MLKPIAGMMKKLLNFVRIHVAGLQRYLKFFIIVNVQFVVFLAKEPESLVTIQTIIFKLPTGQTKCPLHVAQLNIQIRLNLVDNIRPEKSYVKLLAGTEVLFVDYQVSFITALIGGKKCLCISLLLNFLFAKSFFKNC